jgi:hypothetical protein
MRSIGRIACVAALLAIAIAAPAQADKAMISGKCKATGWGRGALSSDLAVGTFIRFNKQTYVILGPSSKPGIVITACPGFKARRATYSIARTATAAAQPFGLSAARAGTAGYHNIEVAVDDGYGEFTDAAGIACIDNPGVGGMGIHFAKLALVLDDTVNAATPEALVYEPEPNGRMRLVATEYVVFKDAWDATHESPPSLFGRQFELMGSPNRYGLPSFYELHAWVWKQNPRGMFDDWNPRVSCDAAAA